MNKLFILIFLCSSIVVSGEIICPKTLDLKLIAKELIHLELSGSRVASFNHDHPCLKQEHFNHVKTFLTPSSEGIDHSQFFIEKKEDIKIETVSLISKASLTYKVEYTALVYKEKTSKEKVKVKESLSFYLNKRKDAQKFSGCAVTFSAPEKIITYLKCSNLK